MRRRALLLLVLVGASARAESPPAYGGSARISLLGRPGTLAPAQALSFPEVALSLALYDPLYRVAEGGAVVPGLAAALPEVSPDGLVARVRLRAARAGGAPLGAAEVAAGLRLAAAAPLAAWALAPVAAVEVDGDAVVLRLRRPAPELARLLAAPETAIAAPGGGSGPFRLLGNSAAGVTLARQDGGFAGDAYLDRVDVAWFDRADAEAKAYERGELDVSLRGAVAFAGHKPLHPTATVDAPATLLVYVGFGRGRALLGDVDFRRALSLAVSRQGLADLASGERALPALLPASPDLGGPALPAADGAARPEAAAAALAAALPRSRGAGGPLEILVDATRPEDAEVAARLVAALEGLGLGATYRALDPVALRARVDAGQADLYVGQLVAPSADVADELALAFAAGGDRWAEERLRSGPLDAAAAASAFSARLPVLPLLHRGLRAHHVRALRGLVFDGAGRPGLADLFRAGGQP